MEGRLSKDARNAMVILVSIQGLAIIWALRQLMAARMPLLRAKRFKIAAVIMYMAGGMFIALVFFIAGFALFGLAIATFIIHALTN
jgi:hypothetical protein